MTERLREGAALPMDLDDGKSCRQLQRHQVTASRTSAQGFRHSQAEIEHEVWVMLGELDELRRYKERIAANRRGRR